MFTERIINFKLVLLSIMAPWRWKCEQDWWRHRKKYRVALQKCCSADLSRLIPPIHYPDVVFEVDFLKIAAVFPIQGISHLFLVHPTKGKTVQFFISRNAQSTPLRFMFKVWWNLEVKAVKSMNGKEGKCATVAYFTSFLRVEKKKKLFWNTFPFVLAPSYLFHAQIEDAFFSF